MSTIKLAIIVKIAENITRPRIAEISRFLIESTVHKPRPGHWNIVSVSTEPLRRPAKPIPNKVTVGIIAFLEA